MHQILKDIYLPGIVKPGQIYTFTSEKNLGWQDCPVERPYIRRNEDILPTLEMELRKEFPFWFAVTRLLKWGEVLVDSYEFRFILFDTWDKEEFAYSFYLHRISILSELFDRLSSSN